MLFPHIASDFVFVLYSYKIKCVRPHPQILMSDYEFVKILYEERHTLLMGATAAYCEGIDYS